ncbi:MAG: hypothetical protein EB078_10420 [Proteobacteria bacterium]|nr:hypothetical protein [Pseudomonadota bacterium]
MNVTTSEGQSRVVLDPSYEQSPLDIRKWVFHFASKADHCRVAQYLHEFKDTSALGGCVVITASMYHYIPQDLDLVNPPVNWRCDDLKAVESALRAPAPYSDWKKYTDFLPDYCR